MILNLSFLLGFFAGFVFLFVVMLVFAWVLFK